MYVVTGGAGFIGSAFVAKLNALGIEDVLIVDELAKSEKWKNLLGLKFVDYMHKNEFMEAILAQELPGGIDAIIHMGACSDTAEQNADYLMENNYRYTVILAEFAAQYDIRFVYASSAATYGAGTAGYDDQHEAIEGLRPLNRYGYSKQIFDLWAAKNGYLDSIAGIKFFNVFGPNEYHKENMRSVVHKAHAQVRESGRVKLFKSYRDDFADGEQQRDFVYVKDCLDVIWWLAQNREVNGIYNLGTGKARSWNDLVAAVFKALGKPLQIDYIEMPAELRTQYQYFTQAKMEKLIAAGYKGKFCSLEESVADYVLTYLENDNPFLSAETLS